MTQHHFKPMIVGFIFLFAVGLGVSPLAAMQGAPSVTLNVAQKFLVLTINSKIGNFKAPLAHISVGFVAGLLFDLEKAGRIECKDDKVWVKNPQPTGDIVRDFILGEVNQKFNGQAIGHTIHGLAQDRSIYRANMIYVTALIRAKILNQKKMEKLDWKWNRGGPRKNTYLLTKLEVADPVLLEGIRKTALAPLMEQKEPGRESAALISIIYGCKLGDTLRKGVKIKKSLFKKQATAITDTHPLGKNVKMIIKACGARGARNLQGFTIIHDMGTVYRGSQVPLPTERKK